MTFKLALIFYVIIIYIYCKYFFNMSIDSIIKLSPFLAFGVYLYRDELKSLLTNSLNFVVNQATCVLHIKKFGNEKMVFAIYSILEKKYLNKSSQLDVRQGNNDINYSLPNGTYYLFYKRKIIFFKLTDDEVIVWSCFCNIKLLKMFLNDIYIPDGQADVVFFYLSIGDKWDVPLLRRPRKNFNISPDMQLFLDNVQKFYNNEDKYARLGRAYRKGYFIEGDSGTGKSSIIEILANEYGMCVYLVNLNTINMSDAVLINLVGQVPPKSIVVFEEFDKQFQAIQNNNNIHISPGGILSAIDGPQRLSHGTIVIMTVNDTNVFPQNFITPLLRKGRLDKSFVFN
jgi:hypothetical protein